MKTGSPGARASSGMIWKAVEAWIGTVRERVDLSGRAAPWMSWLRRGGEGARSAGAPAEVRGVEIRISAAQHEVLQPVD